VESEWFVDTAEVVKSIYVHHSYWDALLHWCADET